MLTSRARSSVAQPRFAGDTTWTPQLVAGRRRSNTKWSGSSLLADHPIIAKRCRQPAEATVCRWRSAEPLLARLRAGSVCFGDSVRGGEDADLAVGSGVLALGGRIVS